MFKLKLADVMDGLIAAVIGAVLAGLLGLVNTPGFSFIHADWGAIFNSCLNWGSAAFLGYVGNIFLSNKQGSVLGIGPKSQ